MVCYYLSIWGIWYNITLVSGVSGTVLALPAIDLALNGLPGPRSRILLYKNKQISFAVDTCKFIQIYLPSN